MVLRKASPNNLLSAFKVITLEISDNLFTANQFSVYARVKNLSGTLSKEYISSMNFVLEEHKASTHSLSPHLGEPRTMFQLFPFLKPVFDQGKRNFISKFKTLNSQTRLYKKFYEDNLEVCWLSRGQETQHFSMRENVILLKAEERNAFENYVELYLTFLKEDGTQGNLLLLPRLVKQPEHYG